MPTKGPRSKRASRSAFNKNSDVAYRLSQENYRSQHAARFADSVSAAAAANSALFGPERSHLATIAQLGSATELVIRGVGKLMALSRYYELDTALLMNRAAVTLSQIRARSPALVIDASRKFTKHLLIDGTSVPTPIRDEARALLNHVNAAAPLLMARDAGVRELAALRRARSAAVKLSSEDLTVLSAELRHADQRYGTNWCQRILGESPRSQASRTRARPTAEKPARNPASKTPAAQMAPASATPAERIVPAANASPATPGDSANQLSATTERAFSYAALNEASTHRQPAKPVG